MHCWYVWGQSSTSLQLHGVIRGYDQLQMHWVKTKVNQYPVQLHWTNGILEDSIDEKIFP